jgi:hypothetical protein
MSQEGGGKPPPPVQKTIFGYAPGKGAAGPAGTPPPQFGPPPGAPTQVDLDPPQFEPLPGAPTQLEMSPPTFEPPPPQQQFGPPPGAPPQGQYGPPPQQYGPPPGAPPQQQFGPPPGAPPQQQFGPPPGAPPQQQFGPPPGAPYMAPHPQGMGEVLTYPLHAGARGAYMFVGVLLFILIIGIPFAIWAFIARSRGRMEVQGLEVRSYGFFTRRLDLSRARRIGFLEVPIYARGIGGAIARRKVGGNKAVHLCTMDEQGRKANILVSMYERFPEVIQHAQRVTGLPLEEVKVGALGPKWPG